MVITVEQGMRLQDSEARQASACTTRRYRRHQLQKQPRSSWHAMELVVVAVLLQNISNYYTGPVVIKLRNSFLPFSR